MCCAGTPGLGVTLRPDHLAEYPSEAKHLPVCTGLMVPMHPLRAGCALRGPWRRGGFRGAGTLKPRIDQLAGDSSGLRFPGRLLCCCFVFRGAVFFVAPELISTIEQHGDHRTTDKQDNGFQQ